MCWATAWIPPTTPHRETSLWFQYCRVSLQKPERDVQFHLLHSLPLRVSPAHPPPRLFPGPAGRSSPASGSGARYPLTARWRCRRSVPHRRCTSSTGHCPVAIMRWRRSASSWRDLAVSGSGRHTSPLDIAASGCRSTKPAAADAVLRRSGNAFGITCAPTATDAVVSPEPPRQAVPAARGTVSRHEPRHSSLRGESSVPGRVDGLCYVTPGGDFVRTWCRDEAESHADLGVLRRALVGAPTLSSFGMDCDSLLASGRIKLSSCGSRLATAGSASRSTAR